MQRKAAADQSITNATAAMDQFVTGAVTTAMTGGVSGITDMFKKKVTGVQD